MRPRLAKTSVLVVVLIAFTVLWGGAQALAQPAPKFPGGLPKPTSPQFAPGAVDYYRRAPVSPATPRPKGLPGLPAQSWGDLGKLALDVALNLLSGNELELLSGNKPKLLSGNETELLSGNETELLSGNETELFSGNKPKLLSGNETELLSGNKPKFLNGNRVSVLSGNKLEIRIVNSGNNNGNHGPPRLGPPPGVKPAAGASVERQALLLRAASAAAAAGGPARSRAPQPSQRFKQLDLNGDGAISLEEFLRAGAQ
jgi:hypothetical protein